MGSKIYVGGLPYSTTEQQLSDLFAAHGAVTSSRIITDKFTGQSRGFGFVEMSSDAEAKAAITALNGTEMGGRTLTVNPMMVFLAIAFWAWFRFEQWRSPRAPDDASERDDVSVS